jgi:hypothetical protein
VGTGVLSWQQSSHDMNTSIKCKRLRTHHIVHLIPLCAYMACTGQLYKSLGMRMTWWVGPCHYNMACPQVADGGTASNMEGGCEYTE